MPRCGAQSGRVFFQSLEKSNLPRSEALITYKPLAGEEIRPKLGVISSLPPQTFLPLVPVAWEGAGFRSLEALKPCKNLGPVSFILV